MDNNTQSDIEKFRGDINLWVNAYQRAEVSYLTFQEAGKPKSLLLARIVLLGRQAELTRQRDICVDIIPGCLCAGALTVPKEGLAVYLAKLFGEFEMQIRGEGIKIDDKMWPLRYSSYDSTLSALNQNWPRTAKLTLSGDDLARCLDQIGGSVCVDNALRINKTPYDGFMDLAQMIGLPDLDIRRSKTIEIIADTPVVLDRAKSIISDSQARLSIVGGVGLDTKQVSIGLRTVDNAIRTSIECTCLPESNEDGTWHVALTCDVGAAPAAQIFVSYGGIAFDRWWIADPTKHSNPFRTLYETCDPGLSELGARLSQPKNQDQFEAAIATLLYLLGFNTYPIDQLTGISNHTDILASTPQMEVFLVECTLGTIDNKGKLLKLSNRLKEVQGAMAQAGLKWIRVSPVVVTTQTTSEVAPDLERAANLGISVISKEVIQELTDKTVFQPNADALVHELRKKQEAYKANKAAVRAQ